MSKAKFAYAIWPWGLETKEQMIQALKDVGDIGYEAFESVESAVDLFDGDIGEFKRIIDDHGVKPASFYFWLKGDEKDDVGRVRNKIEFLAANDVQRMSVQGPKWSGSPATQEELDLTLRIIEQIGDIAKDNGVVPCVHPHHGTWIMHENEIDFIMQRVNPEYVAFNPDTAHLAAGKCDPVEIVERYKDSVKFTHLKDLKMDTALEEDAKGEQGFAIYENFRELGEGDVDMEGVFRILKSVGYDGYLLPELDRSRFSNKESARINMEYLKRHWKEV